MPVYVVGVDLIHLNTRFPGCSNIEPDYFTSRWEVIETVDEKTALAEYRTKYRHWLTEDELPSLAVLGQCISRDKSWTVVAHLKSEHHKTHEVFRAAHYPELHKERANGR
jgi:hypothetical protein